MIKFPIMPGNDGAGASSARLAAPFGKLDKVQVLNL